MGKKKNKTKFVSVDVNNLPTTSTKINKKPNNSINTSSDLSVTSNSSKANESIDNSSMKFEDEILNNSQDDVKDSSCKSLRSEAYSENKPFSASDHQNNLIQCNQNENSSECMTTQYCSEVTDKMENMTFHPQSSSEHSRKRRAGSNKWDTKSSSFHDHDGNNKNHSKATYKNDNPKNQKKYETYGNSPNNFEKERIRYPQEKNKYSNWVVQEKVKKQIEQEDVEPETVTSEWYPIETEPSAHDKSFPSNEGVESSKDEACQSENATYDNNWAYQGRQRKRAGSLGRGQYEGNNYNENWRKKDTTHYSKRYSEGNNEGKKALSPWGDAKTSRQSRDSFDRGFENVDKEYRQFQGEERNRNEVEYVRVSEIQQDLFTVSTEYSLAHCVAEDMRMGSGIAVSFKRDFKDIDVLLNQRQKQGGLAVLQQEIEGGIRYIYYLVTKRVSNGKPTYETLWTSLKKMREHIKEHNVTNLAIPRLGCGLDRLEWSRVKYMIEFLFRDVQVEIIVCNFQQTEDSPEKPLNQTCKIVNVAKPVANIEEETTIIYLSTMDGHVSSVMEQLSKKFSFIDEFKRAPKQLGSLIKYQVPKKYYVLYGCIVRKTEKDPIDFVNFRKCVSQIDKNNKKDQYSYVAIQAIKDDYDDLINDKLITILRNYLHKIELYVCWDGELVAQMPFATNLP